MSRHHHTRPNKRGWERIRRRELKRAGRAASVAAVLAGSRYTTWNRSRRAVRTINVWRWSVGFATCPSINDPIPRVTLGGNS